MLSISVQSTKLNRTLERIWNATNVNAFGLVKQTMIFAVQSMAKLTKPGTGGSYQKLAKRYRTRPITKRPDGKVWYARQKSGKNQMFLMEDKISVKSLRRQKIIKVTSAIQAWSKRKNDWRYDPWWPGVTPEKYLKIPYAGAAKGTWLRGLRFMGESSDASDDITNHVTYKAQDVGTLKSIAIRNMISYASKIQQGGGVAEALRRADARMRNTYFPKFKRKVVEAAHAV